MLFFLISLLVCIGLILAMRAIAHHIGMMDHPDDERKQHAHPTPTVGGIAMFIAVMLAFLVQAEFTRDTLILLTCSACLVLLGFFDDKHNLSVRIRLLIQISLVLMVIHDADGLINKLGSVFGLPLTLGFLALPFSVIAFVGAINAMNMIDGADGMAGSMAIISCIGIAVLSITVHFDFSPDLPFAMIGALCGFLLFNARILVKRAWVFMGDAGSMWLGLAIAWMMSQVSQGEGDPWVSLWLFGLPLIDTLAVMFRRIHRKKSPFKADRTHIHHIFERRGLSIGHSVLLAASAQTLLVATGVVFYLTAAPTLLVLGSFLALFAIYYYLLRNQH